MTTVTAATAARTGRHARPYRALRIAARVLLVALAIAGYATVILHGTHHLDWLITSDPQSIIGGQGIVIGPLHVWLH